MPPSLGAVLMMSAKLDNVRLKDGRGHNRKKVPNTSVYSAMISYTFLNFLTIFLESRVVMERAS